MASSERLPDELMEELEAGSAGSKEYMAQKKRNLTNFKKFLTEVENVTDTLEEVMANTETFENYVKNYFFGIKIEETVKNPKTGKLEKTGRRVLPKMGYSKNIKASLFGVFTKEYKVGRIGTLRIFLKFKSSVESG